MTRVFRSLDEYAAAVGEEIGVSSWRTVDQDLINAYADVSSDHQWIHVDEGRAASGPWGTTIAHGFLTLAITPMLIDEIWTIEGVTSALNYGVDKVRFPAALPVGRRVRARGAIIAAGPHRLGLLSTVRATVEAEGVERPVCVADLLVLSSGQE